MGMTHGRGEAQVPEKEWKYCHCGKRANNTGLCVEHRDKKEIPIDPVKPVIEVVKDHPIMSIAANDSEAVFNLPDSGLIQIKLKDKPACESCRFACQARVDHSSGEVIQCRRYPKPFPTVNYKTWCGEYQHGENNVKPIKIEEPKPIQQQAPVKPIDIPEMQLAPNEQSAVNRLRAEIGFIKKPDNGEKPVITIGEPQPINPENQKALAELAKRPPMTPEQQAKLNAIMTGSAENG